MNYKELEDSFFRWVSSTTGHNIFTYLIFVIISALFWCLTTLNEEVQKDISVPVVIENVPDNVTLMRNEPIKFNLTIKDKGSSLIKYALGKKATLKINFFDVKLNENTLKISQQQALSSFRDLLGQAQIISFKPDTILVPFTILLPKRVPININNESIMTGPGYVISDIRIKPDSVDLFSSKPISSELTSIHTNPIVLNNISDTVTIAVNLATPKGIFAKPDKVNVTICVVPLIKGNKNIAVTPVNMPENRKIVTFPSTVNVTYLVPMDYYKSDDIAINVVADFSKHNSATSKIPLTIESHSNLLQNVTITTDSVEYIIE